MIGKKVRVFWPVDSSWYTGTVQQFDSNSGEHLLKYQDGDTEWVRIGENNTTGHAAAVEGASPPDPAAAEETKRPDNGPPSAAPSGGGGGTPAGTKKWEGYPPGFFPGASPYGGMPPHYGALPGMVPGPYGMMYPPYGPGGPMYGYPGQKPPDNEDSKESSSSRRKSGPKAWSKAEDEMLLSIVHSMQWPMKWTVVAHSLPDRTGKQCRERYVNHLNPRLKITDWTLTEDATIFYLYNAIGSHWAKMSKVIPGRTDNGIKNRFHNIRRQYEREDEHRLRLTSVMDHTEEIRMDRLRKTPLRKLNTDKLWDMHAAIGIIAAQSVLDASNANSRNANTFGPFRKGDNDPCVRCGFLVPSLQTGREICTKTSWCQSCTRVSPHASSDFLRECLNLRRSQEPEIRAIIESWEEMFKSPDTWDKTVKKEDEEEGTDGADGAQAEAVKKEASE